MITRVEESLHLSVMDQNSNRGYIQTLQIFPFPDDSQAESAIKTLAVALWVTIAKLPFLAGTVGPADPKTGKLSLKYPTEILDVQKTGHFASKKLSYPDDFAHSYTQLKAAGMPPSAFTGDTFCPYTLRDRDGVPRLAEGIMDFKKHAVPVLAVQAFFISGALVLSIYVHHNVVDCSGINNFWKHFSDSVLHRRGQTTLPGVRVPDQSALRLEVDARIPDVPTSPIADAFIHDKFEYPSTLSQNSPCSAKIFVIPAAKIRAFRNVLRQRAGDDRDETRLTICNVIAALVWIHVTRARAERLANSDYVDSCCGIAVDTRRRLDPPLSDEYMGVMATFAKATLPIRDFVNKPVTQDMILSNALEIRRTISRIDNAWVLRHLAFFKTKVPIKDTEPALRFRFGPDIYITSWMNFGADNRWNIPGTTSERPEFIRRTVDRNSDGGIIIFPRRRAVVDGQEAPYEVLIRLATEDMQRVEDEVDGLSSWAERVIE